MRHAGLDPLTPVSSWLRRTQALIDTTAPISALDLRLGDRIFLGVGGQAPRWDFGTSVRAPFDVLFVSGPLAGTQAPIAHGTHVIGRGSASAIVVQDPSVSRQHLSLSVTRQGIHASDMDSRNGSYVDGAVIEEMTEIAAGAMVRVGNSMFSLEEPTRGSQQETHQRHEGRLQFNRPPRVVRPDAARTFALPDPPERPAARRFPMAASVVPVVFGIALWLILGQAAFLLFAGIGPAMAIFSLVDDRRSGRLAFDASSTAFKEQLASIGETIATAHQDDIALRRAAAPSAAHLVRSTRDVSHDLWQRRPADSDFLRLRVGSALLPSRLTITGCERGAADLRNRGDRVRNRHRVDADVPVTIDFDHDAVVGVAGVTEEALGVVRWLVAQAAALHSPRDLAVVAIVPDIGDPRWSWLPWLPHTESARSASAGVRLVTDDPVRARELFDFVERLMDERRTSGGGYGPSQAQSLLPRVLLLLADDSPIAPPRISRLLATGPAYGLRAVCLARKPEQLPGECRAVVRVVSDIAQTTLALGEAGLEISEILADSISVGVVANMSRSLAAIRDVGADRGSGEVPPQVRLLPLLPLDPPSAGAIRARWSSPADGLVAVLGAGSTGTVRIDLTRDGPHALVAGTTGSGKSEFLQTLVASLAATYPPDRLTFVLIDYKGGAAFKDCVGLPHTVGFFTDLDPHLARRALTSLDAELRHRERVLRTFGASDLVSLQASRPGDAPASLVIIIDEFAFLKKEVPEFVAGIVDIAQRGRSLGVHLVLATQRPGGVIDDQVRANTNVRIALRVNDDSESADVIGRPDAARIPRSMPGRAYIRTGHAEVREVQTGYVGGFAVLPTSMKEIRVRSFPVEGDAEGDSVRVATHALPMQAEGERVADLPRLVAEIRTAAKEQGVVQPRTPWLEPLAGCYSIEAICATTETATGRLVVPTGVLDQPSRQRQSPWACDLDRDGSVLVYGATGAGKTTFLRTVAASMASTRTTDEVAIYGLDFGAQELRSILALPHCGDVVIGADTERTEALFSMLDRVAEERKGTFGELGVSSVSEYRVRTGQAMPSVVVLLDGYAEFRALFDQVDQGELVDRLARLAGEGRALGLHFVITASRRGAIPANLATAAPGRIVLRMAEEDEYTWLGVPADARRAALPPGRGFVEGGLELQVAVVGQDPAGAAQSTALEGLGRQLRDRGNATRAPQVEPLPAVVERSRLPPPDAGSLAVAFGLAAPALAPAFARLDEVPVFLVAGPDRSGRTTALVALTERILANRPDVRAYLLAPRRSALTEMGPWTEAARGLDACEALAVSLAEELSGRTQDSSESTVLLVVDDGDELTEGKGAKALERLTRRARDSGLVLLAAAQTHVIHRSFGGWVTELRKAKHGLVLSPDVEVDGDLLGVRFPRRTSRVFPVGRGYLVRRGSLELVQVATAQARGTPNG